MATRAKKAAAPAAAAPNAAAPADTASASAPVQAAEAVLDALKALAVDHRCTLELPPVSDVVPGAVLHVRITGPQSAERLVAECRSHPLIRDVQLLAAHIALEVVVPVGASE